MRAIKPYKTTVVNNNLTDESHSLWSATSSYNASDLVLYENKQYKAVKANTNINPKTNEEDGTITDKTWVDFGFINHLRAFDDENLTTSKGVNIQYELEAGKSNSIAIFNMKNVKDVKIEVLTQENINDAYKIKNTYELSNISSSSIINWEQYINAQVTYNKHIFQELPTYFETKKIKVTLSNGSSEVEVGNMVIGELIELGHTVVGMNGTGIDFSKKEEDKNTGIIKVSKSIYRELFTVKIFNENFNLLNNLISQFIGVHTAFIADANNQFLLFAYIKQQNKVPSDKQTNLTLEEVS